MIIDISKLSDIERVALGEVSADLGITLSEDKGVLLTTEPLKLDGLNLKGGSHISYKGLSRFLRAVALLTVGVKDTQENAQFETLTFMADNSRNAVFNLSGAKLLIKKLALLGYTSLQLYTEDTYEVKGQPFVGYMRGRWTTEQLKEIDSYGQMLGVEIVPCIQTLAHLNALTHWQPYQDIIDTADIMLAGEEKTYRLIEDMLCSMREALTSRRINIGMDEAKLIGAGSYFEKHGYRPRTEILKSHLERVLKLCKKYDFSPMMWSDMFFSQMFKGRYYVEDGALPQDLKPDVPAGVQLIYWDYYHTEESAYKNMLDLHEMLVPDVAFAGGAWKWVGFAPLNNYSLAISKAALSAAKGRVKDVLLTAWGDNGAEASVFSIMPVAAYYAQVCYDAPEGYSDALFEKLFGITLSEFLKLDCANRIGEGDYVKETNNSSKYMLYNDLFLGIFDSNIEQDTAAKMRENGVVLQSIAKRKDFEFNYIFSTLAALTKVLELKADMGVRITNLYRAGDKEGIIKLIEGDLKRLKFRLSEFIAAFRSQWMRENRPQGFEVQEYRLGGLCERINSCSARLKDYCLRGTPIPELEEQRLDFMGRESFSKDKDILYNNYAKTSTPSVF